MNKTQKKQIEKFQKMNGYMVYGIGFFMFSYVILLCGTSANVVSMRNINKNVEDRKTDLATKEIQYMTIENSIALGNTDSSGFEISENAIYVKSGEDNSLNAVAIANIKK